MGLEKLSKLFVRAQVSKQANVIEKDLTNPETVL